MTTPGGPSNRGDAHAASRDHGAMDAHLPRRSFLRSALGLAAGAALAGCRADEESVPSAQSAKPGPAAAPGAPRPPPARLTPLRNKSTPPR